MRAGESTQRQQVKTGVAHIDYVQILNGVDEGEEILLVEPAGPELLSEPLPLGREGRRQWMTEAPASASSMRLGEAPPDVASAARAKLAAVRRQVAAVYEILSASADEKARHRGALLLRCFEVPDETQHVVLVGGKLILVAWGHVGARDHIPEPSELALRFSRPVAPPPAPLPAPTPVLPLPPERRSFAGLLWLLAALAGALCLLLINVCSIRIPGTTIVLSFRTDCPEDIGRTAEARGGRRGALQITLAWKTKDDLDLDVACPGGLITSAIPNHLGPGICGDGIHDLDANRKMESPVADPIENVAWQRDIPGGAYKVRIRPYYMGTRTPVPYTVQVTYEDEQRICTGTVKGIDDGAGWGEIPLTFEPKHPLAECHAERFEMHRCTDDCPK